MYRQFAMMLLCVTAALGPSFAQPVQRLKDVKTVYVGPFGDGPGSELIRSKVISRLVKSGRLDVVEMIDRADAVLTGVAELTKTEYYSANANTTNANASGGSRYHATAGVRLLSAEHKILWADEASNGAFYRSASSSVADRMVKNLLKAIDKDARDRP